MLKDVYGLEAQPWERLDEETGNSYGAFLLYRNLGYKRTLREATAMHYEIPLDEFEPKGRHASNSRIVERWSAKFQWVRRSELWDQHMAAIAQADDENAIKEMKKRQATIASAFQSKVVSYISSISDVDLSKMTLTQMAQVFDIAVKNERLARDTPDSIRAITNTQGQAVEVEVSGGALQRKLEAFLATRDPANNIESGEPPVDDTSERELATPWPTAADDEPFPDTAGPIDPTDEQ